MKALTGVVVAIAISLLAVAAHFAASASQTSDTAAAPSRSGAMADRAPDAAVAEFP